MSNRTVAAVSTPLAVGGIGVVRISGDDAVNIAAKVFKSVSGRDISEMKGYTACFGRVFDSSGEFDEAVLTVFRAPKSYTGEDVAEISCHGGVYLVKRLLRAVLDNGAYPAGAGEFTKRAFLNGKISLTQAEAVGDMLKVQSDYAARAALSLHDGVLFKEISEVKNKLVEISGHLCAWVDYPDEEIEEISLDEISDTLYMAKDRLSKLIGSFDSGKMMREGVDTAIVGRPNAGKSTLMNLMAGAQRSIVTQIEGTTRDVVEEVVRLGDLILNVADTAGLRETDDVVEKIGVELAKKKMEQSQLVLVVFDSSDMLNDFEYSLIDELKDRTAVAIINKIDLEQKIDVEYLKQHFKYVVQISANSKDSLEALTETITEAMGFNFADPNAAMLANERQKKCADTALTACSQAIECLESGFTLDAVTVCITDAIECLGELTGESAAESVIDEVFSKFCVGK